MGETIGSLVSSNVTKEFLIGETINFEFLDQWWI